jgi:hypothetical protein
MSSLEMKSPVLRTLLSVLATATMLSPAFASDKDCVDLKECEHIIGKVDNDAARDSHAVPPNAESNDNATDDGEMFAISVDGQHVAGTPVDDNRERQTDKALEGIDIQVKFDGLGVAPMLNVSTFPVRRAFGAGEDVHFLASSNYSAWVSRGEIRIFADGPNAPEAPIAVVETTAAGAATWVMPSVEDGHKSYVYVLRVYDNEGRFDETKPLTLVRSDKTQAHVQVQDAVAPGYAEDRTAFRNIPVEGGAVTVFGRNVPQHKMASVFGDVVPVDAEGSFVTQQILPPGDHDVEVALSGDKGSGFNFNRSINIPSSEWFYVGLADLTVGKRFGSNNIEDVKAGEFDGVYTKGRAAFYLKGKLKGSYILTAAADTGEDSLKNLFKGLDDKDPRSFLKRIDPDDYYPVYGDDSTSVEDAPTRGKFFVRLARGDSHVMWGNFKTEVKGTRLIRNERALYGANGVYKSKQATGFGERKTEVKVYAAQPGTLPQRDVLRGTGGSSYFLKHHDITVGSETLSVEIRNRTTRQLISRKVLREGEDYQIDYLQGVVLLSSPLQSTADGADVVKTGPLGSHDVYLVAGYEFTPAAGEVDGYVFGGRAQQWLGENVRVGVTGANEKTGAADQKLAGADIQFRHSERTYLEAEVAGSKGPGFGNALSADGGLTVSDITTAGLAGKKSIAYRVHGRVALEDISPELRGSLEAYYDEKRRGFSSLDEQIATSQKSYGAKGDIALTDHSRFTFAHDRLKAKDHTSKLQTSANIVLSVTDALNVSFGVTRTEKVDLDPLLSGNRIDIGAKVDFELSETSSVYLFGQATVDRGGNLKRNDRIGVGGKTALTDKVDLGAEISHGSSGIGAKAQLDYKPTADDHYYLGYVLDSERGTADNLLSSLQGNDLGAFVAGAKHSYNERLSVFAEDKYDMFGLKRSLAQTYGVTYTPSSTWKLAGAIESGTVWDESVNNTSGLKNSDFDRTAISATLGYTPDEKISAAVKGEVRFEDSDDGSRDLTAYYFASRYSSAFTEDWRFLANLDAVLTDASDTTRDGDYVEGSLGYAYRPVDNDRFNALAKYTFLYDVPGADQVTVNGTLLGPQQRSHIFNVDASYDVSKLLTIGGKYGFRMGETRARDGSDGWSGSNAHLAVLRADLHVVKNWDVLVEGRALWSTNGDTADLGALAAVYRHIGENFEVGVGYNFGRFSDDLRDLTADDHGVFMNAVGKF